MNLGEPPLKFNRTEDAVTWLQKQVGEKWVMATPLGLGKPNHFLNLLYDAVKSDAGKQLTLYTALSLNPPHAKPGLEKRFLDPFVKRQWGENYPILHYLKDATKQEDSFPKNIQVHEFYFLAGAYLQNPLFQQNYQSINYTHVAQCLFEAGIQVIVQLVAERKSVDGNRYSLSCNPDLTLDVVERFRGHGKKVMIIGVIHPELPFLGGEAEVAPSFFSALVEDPEKPQELFALPRTPIDETDHLIGFFASQLIADDGTLQIGIGSLSDAVVHSLITRHQENEKYRKLVDYSWQGKEFKAPFPIALAPFTKGLYGLSEMINDGFMYLREAGILKREVHDEVSGRKTYLHGAFYLGSKKFYQWLRNLSAVDFDGLRMSTISKINDLYDPQEVLLRKQRKNGRFLNTCMQVTLLGGAASETLENGKVVSGVGGQYNFVSMALELEGAHSILMLRSTRLHVGKRYSNLVWSHGQLTVPRHLRDQVVTEYGIANIRNKTDQETICALLNICDSEFQTELLALAKKNGKVAESYEIPEWARNNHPGRIKALISEGRKQNLFHPFPFGSDFTEVEEKLVLALGDLKGLTLFQSLKLFLQSLISNSAGFDPELARLSLLQSHSLRDRFYRRLVRQALKERSV